MQNKEWAEELKRESDKNDLVNFLNDFFVNLEVGEITEQLMKQTLGFYIATGEKN